jgi:hypothetical protein
VVVAKVIRVVHLLELIQRLHRYLAGIARGVGVLRRQLVAETVGVHFSVLVVALGWDPRVVGLQRARRIAVGVPGVEQTGLDGATHQVLRNAVRDVVDSHVIATGVDARVVAERTVLVALTLDTECHFGSSLSSG